VQTGGIVSCPGFRLGRFEGQSSVSGGTQEGTVRVPGDNSRGQRRLRRLPTGERDEDSLSLPYWEEEGKEILTSIIRGNLHVWSECGVGIWLDDASQVEIP